MRRRVHEALLDTAQWLRASPGGWYGINPIHPRRVKNDNPIHGSSPLFERDSPPQVMEVLRLLDQAPREMQRIAAVAYLADGPRSLKGRAAAAGVHASTLSRQRTRLLDWLVSASMGDDAPRVATGR